MLSVFYGIEILKVGDEILTKLKEQPNNICKQLNKNEEISFNTGFHRGFGLGYTEAVKNCNIPHVNSDFAKYLAANYPTLLFDVTTAIESYTVLINDG